MKIEIKNLVKKFSDVVAIDNLSVSFNEGITGLVGHNGACKSTLFRCIADILDINEGEILIDGTKYNSLENKNNLFFLPDTPIFPRRSFPKDVFNYYNIFFKMKKEIFDEMINAFSLPKDRRVDGFSKGMLRQLFIAIALSMDVKILLLDEAFDGIDPLAIEKIKEMIIKRANENMTIVVSSHNIATLEKLVDQYVILYKGKLSSEGDEELLGETFIKYQIIPIGDINENTLVENGLKVIKLNKFGSIYHIVLVKNNDIEEKLRKLYKPVLLETVPISSNELIAIEMLYAQKKEEK